MASHLSDPVPGNGDVIPPHYDTIHPNQIAVMGTGPDALLNPQGIGGVGPGAVALGIKASMVDVGDGGGEGGG